MRSGTGTRPRKNLAPPRCGPRWTAFPGRAKNKTIKHKQQDKQNKQDNKTQHNNTNQQKLLQAAP